MESVRLEKTSQIIKSTCQPNTTAPAKPHPDAAVVPGSGLWGISTRP